MNFAPPTRNENVARNGGNVFAELGNTASLPCRAVASREGRSLGQITGCLSNVVGKFRPMV